MEKFTEKDKTDSDKLRAFNMATHLSIYIKTGERYRYRSERVKEWIERDKARQNYYDNAQEPEVSCSKCYSPMASSTKDLHDYDDKPFKVLFFMDCPKCKNREGYFDTGERYISKPSPCPKCKSNLDINIKKSKEGMFKWKTTCKVCGYKDIEIQDFNKEHSEWEKKKAKRQSDVRKI